MFKKSLTIGTKVYWVSTTSTNEEKTEFVTKILSGIVLSSDKRRPE